MHRLIGSVVRAGAVMATVALMPTAANGQARATASYERGPRFLLATASKVVPVDVSRTPVLARRLSLDLEGTTLKDALAEITGQSGLRLAYSDDDVPLNKRVHLRAETITAAAALTDVLLDAGLDVVFRADGSAALVKRPASVQEGTIVGLVAERATGSPLAGAVVVVAGTELSATAGADGQYRIAKVPAGTYTVRARYIGYTPRSASVTVMADDEIVADFALERSPQRLDEVVTTGTVLPTEVRALPTPISVITAAEIEQKGFTRLEEIFRGTIPGATALDPGSDNGVSTVNVRGGSSITGGGSIKIYVDGVEAAYSPSLLRDLNPHLIERIEVVRGPQASTLYGAEALDGVMQIFTKKGAGAGSRRPTFSAMLSAGTIESPLAGRTAVQQDHALALSGASDEFSYRLGGTFRDVGAWLPEYGERAGTFTAAGGINQGPLTLDLSARYFANRQDFAHDPRFQARGYPSFEKPTNIYWNRRQQAYGLTLTYRVSPTWRHVVTAGYDATALDVLRDEPQRLTPADTFLLAYIQPYTRTSFGYHTALTLPLSWAVQATVTAGADMGVNTRLFTYAFQAPRLNGSIPVSAGSINRQVWTNAGYFAQTEVGLWDALFLTGGVRAEQNPNFGDDYGLAWSPRVGAAYVHELGTVTVKTRASYGRGIRPPVLGQKDASISAVGTRQLANPELGPALQQGYDAGLELHFGSRGSLIATYYNQRAIDLIEGVVLAQAPLTQQFQNVGRIKNTGWEFEAALRLGALAVNGTFTVMAENDVQQLSPSYTGTLRVGDRLPGSPRTAGGITVSYGLPRTELALTTTYFGSTVAVDWFPTYLDVLYLGAPSRGSEREYWTTYPAFAKSSLMVSHQLRPELSAYLNIDNLTNNTAAERSDFAIQMGRAATIGLRWGR